MRLFLLILIPFFITSVYGQTNKDSFYFNKERIIENEIWHNPDSLNLSLFDTAITSSKIILLSQNNHNDTFDLAEQCNILQKLIVSKRVNKIFIEASSVNTEIIDSFFCINGSRNIEQVRRFFNNIIFRYWDSNGFIKFIAEQVHLGNLKLYGIDIAGIDPEIVSSLYKEAISEKDIRYFLTNNPTVNESTKIDYNLFSGFNEFSTYPYVMYTQQDKFITEVIKHFNSMNAIKKVRIWNSIRLYYKWMGVRSEQEKAGNMYVSKSRSLVEASKFHSFRDSAMAEIFADLFKTVKDVYKSVILVSAYHSLQNPDEVYGIHDCCIPNSVKTFGQILKEKYAIHFYDIGFIIDTISIDSLSSQKTNKEKGLDLTDKPYLKMPNQNSFILVDSIFPNEFYLKFLFGKSFLSNWNKNFAILYFFKRK